MRLSKLRKPELILEVKRLRERIKELEQVHFLDQSEIILLRRQMEVLNERIEMGV